MAKIIFDMIILIVSFEEITNLCHINLHACRMIEHDHLFSYFSNKDILCSSGESHFDLDCL